MITAGRVVALTSLLALWVTVLFLMWRAKKGVVPTVRRIAGLDAIDEAIGRATEMGKPVVCNVGRGAFTDEFGPQLIAGLSVLDYVSKQCAKYGVEVMCPMSQPTVIPVATEIMQNAYSTHGTGRNFDPNRQLPFYSDSQFAWMSAVMAYAERERPAVNIMIGPFWAETVMLAESYARVGAFQIGGTARLYQLPFLVACCDFSLIGEEIFTAGAYLSKDPRLTCSIAAQDYFKIVAVILSVVGALVATLGVPFVSTFLKM